MLCLSPGEAPVPGPDLPPDGHPRALPSVLLFVFGALFDAAPARGRPDAAVRGAERARARAAGRRRARRQVRTKLLFYTHGFNQQNLGQPVWPCPAFRLTLSKF